MYLLFNATWILTSSLEPFSQCSLQPTRQERSEPVVSLIYAGLVEASAQFVQVAWAVHQRSHLLERVVILGSCPLWGS